MDFSFWTNIVLALTGWVIAFRLWRKGIRSFFFQFFLLSGMSAFFGSIGHGTFVTEETGTSLLFVCRLFGIWSFYAFAKATLQLFDLYAFRPAKTLNAVTPILLVLLLLVQNTIVPVVIYGILSMLILGIFSYLYNARTLPKVSVPMLVGIAFTTAAVVVFASFNTIGEFKPTDISHLLMAIALGFMSVGVKNVHLYEMEI